jgi:hypothetical protein
MGSSNRYAGMDEKVSSSGMKKIQDLMTGMKIFGMISLIQGLSMFNGIPYIH